MAESIIIDFCTSQIMYYNCLYLVSFSLSLSLPPSSLSLSLSLSLSPSSASEVLVSKSAEGLELTEPKKEDNESV